MTRTPHKHAAIIKAWADGAEIEAYLGSGLWDSVSSPLWDTSTTYRIKPKTKLDRVYYGQLQKLEGINSYEVLFQPLYDGGHSQLRLVFDGETGKLKSAGVLK